MYERFFYPTKPPLFYSVSFFNAILLYRYSELFNNSDRFCIFVPKYNEIRYMNPMDTLFAVCNLAGKNINGWEVISQLPEPDRSKGETGGNFSICYIVQKDGIECFMKVLDYRNCMTRTLNPSETRLSVIERATREFKYEMALSEHCNRHNVKNIITYVDGGECELKEFSFPTVTYIVYEKADCNIRKILDFSAKLVFAEKLKTLSFKIKSLHDIALGVKQLHKIEVSHQDLKPSNILSIGNNSKLGDLGRSLCLSPEVDCPYSLNRFNGDWTYAPPEAFFYYRLSEDKERLYQMDNYMIGSLIVFYISGISFNTLLNGHLSGGIRSLASSGIGFDGARAYLLNAYYQALVDFEKSIPLQDLKEGLVKIVEYLCHPEPEKRGHPKNVLATNRTPNYDLERTIAELDLFQRKAELSLYKK